MTYNRIDFVERNQIFQFIKLGVAQKQIACQLQRSSSICEEIKRLKKAYCPIQAQADADQKKQLRKKQPLLEQSPSFEKFIVKRLSLRWSPEQIVGHLKLHQINTICHETIYQWIYKQKDEEKRSLLISCLRHKKRRRRRRNLHKCRQMLRNPLSIHQRPSEAQNRQQVGH